LPKFIHELDVILMLLRLPSNLIPAVCIQQLPSSWVSCQVPITMQLG